MCITQTAAFSCRCSCECARHAQRANIVHEVRAGTQGGRNHFGFAGVDGKHGLCTGREGLDHRHDAIDFLLHAYCRRTRSRRLAADVDDGGTLLDHAQSGRDRGLPFEVQATVRERVWRDVEDTHDGGDVEGQRSVTAAHEEGVEGVGG